MKDIIARKRPFVPIKPEDIQLGDVIKFSRPGGKISRGVVKYMGPLPDRSDTYFGLELDIEGNIVLTNTPETRLLAFKIFQKVNMMEFIKINDISNRKCYFCFQRNMSNATIFSVYLIGSLIRVSS